MSRIAKVTEEQAEGKVAKMYEGLKSKLGRVPNVYQCMATNPDFMQTMMKLTQVAGKALDPKTRELINIAVSTANNCSYCLDAHVAIAKMMGITGEEISAAMETAAAMSAFNVYNHGANPVSDFKAE